MKILYLMNVDWHWIKQRPHFLAEELSKKNELLLLYPHSYYRKGLGFCENKNSDMKPHRYFNLPFRCKIKLVGKLNPYFLRAYFGIIIAFFKPDCVWLCRPEDINYIPSSKKHLVCYDCMDDHFSMTQNEALLLAEKDLVSCAEHIFASSNSLIEKLVSRYGIGRNRITLVRNGYDGKAIAVPEQPECALSAWNAEHKFRICYVGTVSTWFDFELIESVVKAFPQVSFEIIGPVEPLVNDIVSRYSGQPDISFHGSIEHEKLYESIKNYDCMIMPFKLNEIIESVDPVKLYEYINYNKNIICVKYREIERFEPFVYFYDYNDRFVSISGIIKNLLSENKLKYSSEQRASFLGKNTWAERAETAGKVLSGKIGRHL